LADCNRKYGGRADDQSEGDDARHRVAVHQDGDDDRRENGAQCQAAADHIPPREQPRGKSWGREQKEHPRPEVERAANPQLRDGLDDPLELEPPAHEEDPQEAEEG
jgi:hypothetical protein